MSEPFLRFIHKVRELTLREAPTGTGQALAPDTAVDASPDPTGAEAARLAERPVARPPS